MSEWKEYKLKEICPVITDGSHFSPKEYPGGIPMFSVKDMKDNGFDYSKVKRISELDYLALIKQGCQPEIGDILIAKDGSVLKHIFAVKEKPDYVLLSSIAIVKPDNKIVDSVFLSYQLKSPNTSETILTNFVSGSGVPRIVLKDFKEVEISLPSLSEQTAIAEVLSSLDDKIDLLHRQNKTLEQLAETLFRQWFIEEADESWETYKLRDLVKHVKPGTNYQPKRIDNGIPFLNVRNLNNGFLDLSDTTKISDEEYQRIHKSWQPDENDVLISRIGTLGIVAVILKKDLPVAVHYNMINLKAKETSYQFLYFLLKSQLFQEKYFSIVRQSVQEYVAIEDTENIELSLPIGTDLFKERQMVFNDFLDKIKSNTQQIRTLTQLRDSLLPKLMSGEVRINI